MTTSKRSSLFQAAATATPGEQDDPCAQQRWPRAFSWTPSLDAWIRNGAPGLHAPPAATRQKTSRRHERSRQTGAPQTVSAPTALSPTHSRGCLQSACVEPGLRIAGASSTFRGLVASSASSGGLVALSRWCLRDQLCQALPCLHSTCRARLTVAHAAAIGARSAAQRAGDDDPPRDRPERLRPRRPQHLSRGKPQGDLIVDRRMVSSSEHKPQGARLGWCCRGKVPARSARSRVASCFA